MSDRDTRTPNPADDISPGDEMRPLPDGGLTEGLPEWLRRPPAWRNLPRKEEGEELALPDPDTSVIDPRALVDIADLPMWLQQIAVRGEEPALSPPETSETSMQEDTTMQTNDQDGSTTPEQAERQVPFEPVDKKWNEHKEETKVYGGGPPKGPNMMMIGAAVVVILIIVLVVIAIVM